MSKRALYLAFALALILIPVSHTDAGDDYCPGGQMGCQSTCQRNYDTCAAGCYRRYPNNEGAYEACEYQCSMKLWDCAEACQGLWGCYEPY